MIISYGSASEQTNEWLLGKGWQSHRASCWIWSFERTDSLKFRCGYTYVSRVYIAKTILHSCIIECCRSTLVRDLCTFKKLQLTYSSTPQRLAVLFLGPVTGPISEDGRT